MCKTFSYNENNNNDYIFFLDDNGKFCLSARLLQDRKAKSAAPAYFHGNLLKVTELLESVKNLKK